VIPWISDGKQIQMGLRLGGVGIWRWQIGKEDLYWTDNLENVHRMTPGSFDGTLSSFRRDLHPGDAERVWQAITQSVETGEPYSVVYRLAGSSDDQPLWIEARGGVIQGDDGELCLTGVCYDVTDRIKSELELARRLKQQEGVQKLSSYALGAPSLNDVLDRTVETAARIFSVPLTKVLQFVDSADHLQLVAGFGWHSGLVGTAEVGTDHDSQAGFTLMSASPVIVGDLSTETRFTGPNLLREHGVRSGMSVVIPGSSERPFGVIGVHTRDLRKFDEHDVDALISLANIVAQSARQHEAAKHQRLILREMAHRSGNLLQVVASLASQTFRTHADPNVALRSFTSRLDSLSRANHLITRGGWGPTRLRSLVDEVLAAHTDRFRIQGRDVRLPAELAFDLALVLYELATNSQNYGSLSTTGGTIDLRWLIEKSSGGRNFQLDWSDSQVVPRHARGTGFGSKLKRALVEKKWGGTMSVTSEGPYRFSCQIPLPDEVQA
jgi:two-component sensor histidine kinase